MLGIPENRFIHVPWGLLSESRSFRTFNEKGKFSIMISGRSNVDWETTGKAVSKINVPLKVVYTKKDEENVLRWLPDAEKYCDIEEAKHNQLLKDAGVYLIVMHEVNASNGQARLGNAIEACVPVITTANKGILPYVEHLRNAYVVPEKNPEALAEAIETLMTNYELRSSLVYNAFHDALKFSSEKYLARLEKEIVEITSIN